MNEEQKAKFRRLLIEYGDWRQQSEIRMSADHAVKEGQAASKVEDYVARLHADLRAMCEAWRDYRADVKPRTSWSYWDRRLNEIAARVLGTETDR